MTQINKQQRLIDFDRGKQVPHDDFRAIQDQLNNLSQLFANWGAFVLTGCQLSQGASGGSYKDIAEGLVYINDHLIYVPKPSEPGGFQDVDLSTPKYLVEISAQTLSPRDEVLSGNLIDGLEEYRVELSSSQPGSEESIEFKESGAQRTKAADLDLPQAIIDIANLQSNKADKANPLSSYKDVGTYPGYNGKWEDGSGNRLIYWKDDNRKRVYITGSFFYNGSDVSSNVSHITTLDYTPKSSPSLSQPIYYPIWNKDDAEPGVIYINRNGEMWINILTTNSQAEYEVGLIEFPID